MEKLSSSLATAEHKLLILYVLDKARTPIDSIRLNTYMLEYRLMNYLVFQQRVHELAASGHIECSPPDGHTDNAGSNAAGSVAAGSVAAGSAISGSAASGASYAITESGVELLASMTGLLPKTEKNRIDRTVGVLRRRELDGRAVTADYEPGAGRHMTARLALTEGAFSAIRLEIAVPSAGDARAVCARWKERAPEIYARIYELLTGDD